MVLGRVGFLGSIVVPSGVSGILILAENGEQTAGLETETSLAAQDFLEENVRLEVESPPSYAVTAPAEGVLNSHIFVDSGGSSHPPTTPATTPKTTETTKATETTMAAETTTAAATRDQLPARCPDLSAAPTGHHVTYNITTFSKSQGVGLETWKDVCINGKKFGDKVSSRCCESEGNFNMLGKTLSEIYKGADGGTCPKMGRDLYAIVQGNADGSITYGEHGCGTECQTCQDIVTMKDGCYRANDLPGTWFFVKAENCACNPAKPVKTPPLPERCDVKSVAPRGHHVVYNFTAGTKKPLGCAGFSFGEKVPDECCTGAGSFNALKKTLAEVYTAAGNDTCAVMVPNPVPEKVLTAIVQCNADGSITYGEHGCGPECASCHDVKKMAAGGCYKANDLPGTSWFVKSEGCSCPPPGPTEATTTKGPDDPCTETTTTTECPSIRRKERRAKREAAVKAAPTEGPTEEPTVVCPTDANSSNVTNDTGSSFRRSSFAGLVMSSVVGLVFVSA